MIPEIVAKQDALPMSEVGGVAKIELETIGLVISSEGLAFLSQVAVEDKIGSAQDVDSRRQNVV